MSRHAGVGVEFSRPTFTCSRHRLSIAFSDLDQYFAVPDLSRHVGKDWYFFQYVSQVWSCFSRLFQSFFFLRKRTSIINFLLLLCIPSLLLVVPTLLTCLNVNMVWRICCRVWQKAYTSVVCELRRNRMHCTFLTSGLYCEKKHIYLKTCFIDTHTITPITTWKKHIMGFIEDVKLQWRICEFCATIKWVYLGVFAEQNGCVSGVFLTLNCTKETHKRMCWKRKTGAFAM